MELIVRFLVGGALVSLFAVMGDVFRPRSFGGLFGAAPSVAIATLSLTILVEGKAYATIESRSMIAGGLALLVYALVTIKLLARYNIHALTATIWAIPVWLICSFGIYLSLLR